MVTWHIRTRQKLASNRFLEVYSSVWRYMQHVWPIRLKYYILSVLGYKAPTRLSLFGNRVSLQVPRTKNGHFSSNYYVIDSNIFLPYLKYVDGENYTKFLLRIYMYTRHTCFMGNCIFLFWIQYVFYWLGVIRSENKIFLFSILISFKLLKNRNCSVFAREENRLADKYINKPDDQN